MKALQTFLETNHVLTIATVGEPVWVYNVFYTVDKDLNLYFASSTETTHGTYLKQDNHVAFAVTWVEDWNPKNKKGLQGLGVCEQISGIVQIKAALKLLATNKGLVKDVPKYIAKDAISHMYKITPSYIKYIDDEAYGERGAKEFDF